MRGEPTPPPRTPSGFWLHQPPTAMNPNTSEDSVYQSPDPRNPDLGLVKVVEDRNEYRVEDIDGYIWATFSKLQAHVDQRVILISALKFATDIRVYFGHENPNTSLAMRGYM